jgi:hypothetical protein
VSSTAAVVFGVFGGTPAQCRVWEFSRIDLGSLMDGGDCSFCGFSRFRMRMSRASEFGKDIGNPKSDF